MDAECAVEADAHGQEPLPLGLPVFRTRHLAKVVPFNFYLIFQYLMKITRHQNRASGKAFPPAGKASGKPAWRLPWNSNRTNASQYPRQRRDFRPLARQRGP
jgi:hypothetical protein